MNLITERRFWENSMTRKLWNWNKKFIGSIEYLNQFVWANLAITLIVSSDLVSVRSEMALMGADDSSAASSWWCWNTEGSTLAYCVWPSATCYFSNKSSGAGRPATAWARGNKWLAPSNQKSALHSSSQPTAQLSVTHSVHISAPISSWNAVHAQLQHDPVFCFFIQFPQDLFL